jgi:SAM-dependent methyltransferase
MARITYRPHGGSRAYWQARWDDVDADTGELNLQHYPGKFAEDTLRRLAVGGPILEAGCGAGRVVRFYHHQGRDIIGMDFIPTAVQKIRQAVPTVPLTAADVEKLPFADESLSCVLAFGLYHNLEQGVAGAVRETRRVLKTGGHLCAAMRLDNIQNRMIDWLANRKQSSGEWRFHKINYTQKELKDVFSHNGFAIEDIYFVENMPFVYKFRPFRAASHKTFNETKGRAEGYRLSLLGNAVQKMLIGLFLPAFCNAAVIIARAK